jgi:integrase
MPRHDSQPMLMTVTPAAVTAATRPAGWSVRATIANSPAETEAGEYPHFRDRARRSRMVQERESRSGIYGTIHNSLKEARKWGYIARNPADDADPPKVKTVRARNRDRKVWSPAQLRTFLDSVRDDRLYGAWMLVATTGLRRGETMGLRWEDIDLRAGRLAVAQPRVVINYEVIESDPKTEAGGRTIALDLATVVALKAWKRAQAKERLALGPGYVDSHLVFTRSDGSGIHPQRFSAWFGQRAKLPGFRASGFTTFGTPTRLPGWRLASTSKSCPSDSATPTSQSHRTSTSAC